MTVISQKRVKARKEHRCDLCGCIIKKGDVYEHQFNKDGDVYDFRAHSHCQDMSSKIWNYVDPYEGMTMDAFQEAVQSLAYTFYCPFHCEKWDGELGYCDDFDCDSCVKKLSKFMETRELQLVKDQNIGMCWKLSESVKN